MKFETRFELNQKVSIDGGDLIATIIGFAFYQHGNMINVAWWNSGALVEAWIAAERLRKVGQ